MTRIFGLETEHSCPNCFGMFLVKTVAGRIVCPECEYEYEEEDN